MAYTLWTHKSWAETKDELAASLERWGVRDWTAVKPKASRRANYWDNSADERRVTVEFRHPGGQKIVLTKDDLPRPEDNFRAIFLTIEDLRMIEKRGLSEIMRTAVLQLTAPQVRTCWEILGVTDRAPRSVIEAAYRARAKELHPDAGGDQAAFVALRRAYDDALTALAVTA